MNRGEFWIYWDGGKSGEASGDGWSGGLLGGCCTDTISFPLRLSAHASTPMAPWSSARNTARCTSCARSWPKRAGDSSKFPLYQEVVLKPSTQFLSTLGHKLAGFGGKHRAIIWRPWVWSKKDFLTRNLQQNLLWGLWTLERACFTLVFGDRWPHETAGRTTLWGHNTLTPNLLNIRNIVISHHHLKKTWHSCTIPWAIADSESKSHFAGRDSALFFRPRAEYVISY